MPMHTPLDTTIWVYHDCATSCTTLFTNASKYEALGVALATNRYPLDEDGDPTATVGNKPDLCLMAEFYSDALLMRDALDAAGFAAVIETTVHMGG